MSTVMSSTMSSASSAAPPVSAAVRSALLCSARALPTTWPARSCSTRRIRPIVYDMSAYHAWLVPGRRLSAVPLLEFATVVCSSVSPWFIIGPATTRLSSSLCSAVAEASNAWSWVACWACAATSSV